MRMTQLLLIAGFACVISISGCSSYSYGSGGGVIQEQTGMVIGDALGDLLGGQVGDQGDQARTTAIIVGTLAGAAIGGAIGRSMDETDRLKTSHTLETVSTGVSSSCRNPDTGNAYGVTPTRTFETATDPCRDTYINAIIDGTSEKV